MQRGKVRVEAGVVMLQASRAALERREARKEAMARKEAQAEASDWELGDVDLGTGPSPSLEEKESMEAEVAEERETILERAKSRGRKIADKRADKEEAQIARDSDKVIDDARLLLEPVRIQDNDAEFQLGDVETVQEPVEAAVVVSKAATTLAPRSSLNPCEPKIRRRRAPSSEEVTRPVDGEGPAIVDTRQEVDEREIEKAAREADRERKKEEIEDLSYRLFRFFNMRVPTAKKSMRSNSSKMPTSWSRPLKITASKAISVKFGRVQSSRCTNMSPHLG